MAGCAEPERSYSLLDQYKQLLWKWNQVEDVVERALRLPNLVCVKKESAASTAVLNSFVTNL